MHTVELLEIAIAEADKLGYEVRQEWLGGTGGGRCEFAGRRVIFIDLALNSAEQLDQVIEALLDDPAFFTVKVPRELQPLLGIKHAA